MSGPSGGAGALDGGGMISGAAGALTALTALRALSGDGGPPAARAAWAELLRLPALFTVPGDALAGAAAATTRPNSRTLLAICSSLCLYEAGMALNDWADRDEDAVERPHRPLPSGRIRPAAALTAACAFTGAGLSLAACAGRPALTVATTLAATVWAYDLALKHTPAGPFAMAAARGLDLLLGATVTAATSSRAAGDLATTPISDAPSAIGRALPSAALLGVHTLTVTTVSRRETQGGAPLIPLTALAATTALTRLLARPSRRRGVPAPPRDAAPRTALAVSHPSRNPHPHAPTSSPDVVLRTALAAAYAVTAARPYFHATLNPSPPLTQRAVGGGIRATIPLQAALSARSGAPVTALLTAALAPLAAKFARKVSVT